MCMNGIGTNISLLKAFASFLPIILLGQGKTIAQAQLLSAPPFVVAVAFALPAAYACDRVGKRGAFLIAQSCICIVGLMMTAYGKQNKVSFVYGSISNSYSIFCF